MLKGVKRRSFIRNYDYPYYSIKDKSEYKQVKIDLGQMIECGTNHLEQFDKK